MKMKLFIVYLSQASILTQDEAPSPRLSEIYIDLHKILDAKDSKVCIQIVLLAVNLCDSTNISYEVSKRSMLNYEII